jgi:hypothetical protein
MRGVSIVRSDYSISVLVGAFIVAGRSPHKREVHKEFRTARGNPFRNVLCSLLSDVGLFFEVNRTEGVIFENRRRANYMTRKEIELTLTR